MLQLEIFIQQLTVDILLVEQIHISTLVQGTQAKQDIIEKIEHADTLDADTIIVGRGGSIEDLWNFNEEEVVKSNI